MNIRWDRSLVVVISARKNPSTTGGHDGSLLVEWAAVPGAERYKLRVYDEEHGLIREDENVTSPHTIRGLSAGVYAVMPLGAVNADRPANTPKPGWVRRLMNAIKP